MFPWMIPILMGAAGGALLSRKDPLKGAIIGAGLGAGSAMLAPGLLGGAAAADAGTQAGLLAAQEAGLDTLGWGGATTGVQGALNRALGSEAGSSAGGLLGGVNKVAEYAKPIGQAAQTAMMFQPPDRPPPMPQIPPMPMATGPQGLTQLAGQNAQLDLQRMQDDWARRQLQKQRIARMGMMG